MFRLPQRCSGVVTSFTCPAFHFGAYYSSPSSKTRELEVERKFVVTPASLAYLRSDEARSCFPLFKHLGKRTIHDIYYDKNDILLSRGIYVRKRNGVWGVKFRVGGDFINSAFIEIEDEPRILEKVMKALSLADSGKPLDEILCPRANFVTERESWTINKFKVDVDTTDFSHTVGEVELSRTLPTEEMVEKEEEMRREMDEEIQLFMEAHPQLFPPGVPIGKLSAYFRKYPQGK